MTRGGIRLHWSWAPSLGVLVWTLAADHLPAHRVDGAGSIGVAAVVAILALGCVLAHEMARRFAASTAGFKVPPATLWPAGAAWVPGSPPSARADVRMLGAGVFASLALAGLFAVGAEAAPASIAEGGKVLARFNWAFAILGLTPALPLAGGVFLRSRMIAGGVPAQRAARWGARAGVTLGGLLVAAGSLRIAAGDVSGGLGLGVLGITVAAAAHGMSRRSSLDGRALTPRGVLSAAALGVAVILPASILYHPPLALLAPGDPLDVLAGVRIRGFDVSPVRGRYVAASVQIRDPTALHAFIALFRSRVRLVPRSSLPPVIEDPFRERGLGATFEGSRVFAAAAAAHSVGLDVAILGTGARLIDAGPHARAAGLRPGDVIVAVNHRRVQILTDLRAAVTGSPSGTEFTLTVERGGRRLDARMRSRTGPLSAGVPGLDADLETNDLRVELPFEVTFPSSGAGPSAGLAFALAFADLLDGRDIAAGRTIAATGVIHLTGQADPIIGAIAKVRSAIQANAAVFVVPLADAHLISDPQIRLIGVRSLQEAIALLLGGPRDSTRTNG